eukprot:8183462-Ditylum_brightwellii.AAC.1
MMLLDFGGYPSVELAEGTVILTEMDLMFSFLLLEAAAFHLFPPCPKPWPYPCPLAWRSPPLPPRLCS